MQMVLLLTHTDDLCFLLTSRTEQGLFVSLRLDFDERLRCFKVSIQDVQTKMTPFCLDHYSFKLEGSALV